MIGLWEFYGVKMVKVHYLGVSDPSAIATPSALEASNGWLLTELSTSCACMGSLYIV